MSEEIALKAEGLTKSYGKIRALHGVDLEVRRGEIFGFLGPNGAGKTTTIRCLLDLIRPDGGAAVFFSSHIISEVEALAERVAIIRQGVIVEEAEPKQLVSMALRRVQVRFKEAVNPAPLAEVDGVTLLAESNGIFARLQVEGEMDGLIKALG